MLMDDKFSVRILVVNADRVFETELAQIIEQKNGYKAWAAQAQDFTPLSDAWFQQLRRLAHENNCHILLLDQRILKKSKKTFEDLKQSIDYAQCILYVGNTIRTDRAMRAFASGLLLAPPPSNERLLASGIPFKPAITHAVFSRRAPSIKIKPEEQRYLEDAASTIGTSIDEVTELLAYLFPKAEQLELSPLESEQAHSTVARGRSALLTVSEDGKVDEVLKLGPRDRIEAEAWNYSEHIERRLPGMRYAALRKQTILWRAGGLVYSLLGTKEKLPPSFARRYKSNNTTILITALQDLFEPWGRHYKGNYQHPAQTQIPLFDQYDKVWSHGGESKLTEKLDTLKERLATISLSFVFNTSPLKTVEWVLENRGKSATRQMHQCITHGDLHSHNIRVDDQGHCWVLDFERTGLGPILQDFVELETDIITRLIAPENNLEQVFRLCVALVAPKNPSDPLTLYVDEYFKETLPVGINHASQIIAKLRSLANDYTKYEDSREYLWGLLLNALYAASLYSRPDRFDQERVDRAFILAEVIRQRLLGWENYLEAPDWPTQELKSRLDLRLEVRLPEPSSKLPPELKLQLTDLNNEHHKVFARPVKILFLSANPSDTTSLQLDEEIRAIDNALQRGSLRDYFQVAIHTAVRADDLQRLLERHQPDIVHFSGHGGSNGQIYLQGEDGKGHPVAPRALGNLFKLLKKNIRCVVLNACYSDIQAQAIVQHIDAVIGMSHTISDEAAIKFAAGFYEGLAWGHNVQEAFDLGCARIDLANLDEQDKPNLLARSGCHPSTIIFARTPVTKSIPPQEDSPSQNASKHDPLHPKERTPVSVFYSYSHRDEKLRDRLAAHLSLLKRKGAISEWHDRKITAGREWEGQIDAHLNSAQIILLLISADFLASDYCYDVEMTRALERHDAREAQVIPIILKPVDWEQSRFGKLQALPRDGRPVTEWSNRDAAFKNIAQAIRKVVSEIS